MVKLVEYVFAISFFLLLLIGVEFLLTSGEAFDFSNYSVINCITQFLAVVCTISGSISIVEEANKPKN